MQNYHVSSQSFVLALPLGVKRTNLQRQKSFYIKCTSFGHNMGVLLCLDFLNLAKICTSENIWCSSFEKKENLDLQIRAKKKRIYQTSSLSSMKYRLLKIHVHVPNEDGSIFFESTKNNQL